MGACRLGGLNRFGCDGNTYRCTQTDKHTLNRTLICRTTSFSADVCRLQPERRSSSWRQVYKSDHDHETGRALLPFSTSLPFRTHSRIIPHLQLVRHIPPRHIRPCDGVRQREPLVDGDYV